MQALTLSLSKGVDLSASEERQENATVKKRAARFPGRPFA